MEMASTEEEKTIFGALAPISPELPSFDTFCRAM
jgi:hypothetical protein